MRSPKPANAFLQGLKLNLWFKWVPEKFIKNTYLLSFCKIFIKYYKH